jgi:hypothetical protein
MCDARQTWTSNELLVVRALQIFKMLKILRSMPVQMRTSIIPVLKICNSESKCALVCADSCFTRLVGSYCTPYDSTLVPQKQSKDLY